MLDWIGETILAIVTFIPALFISEHSPNYMLFRTMVGLLLIVLVVYIIAMRPVRSAFARWMERVPLRKR